MQHAELVAYLRSLPDDWGSWLVFADALSERGDDRGQFLVLEHRAQDIGALADDWMATWGNTLCADDGEQYKLFRRLATLATADITPDDLRPTFARPVSQLLALLEPGESLGLPLSPVFALQRERVVAAVLAWIDRAFDGVPVPDEDHRTIYQAEAADSYASCDRSRDHLGRWQDLPDAHLLENQWALAHLDEQGIHYYLPAVMSFALRDPPGNDYWLTESLEYTLEPSSPDLRDYEQLRLALLDRAQRAAIYAFTLTRRYSNAAVAWARVFEAERTGERPDWFELYSPR